MLNLPDLRLPAGKSIGGSAPASGLAPAGQSGQSPAAEPAESTAAAEFAALILLLGGGLPETATGNATANATAGTGASGPAAGLFAATLAAPVLAAGGKTLPVAGASVPLGTSVPSDSGVPGAAPAPLDALMDELLAPLGESLSEADLPMRQLERALGLAGARPGELPTAGLPTGLGLAVAPGGLGSALGAAVSGAASANTGLAVGSLPLPGPGVPGFEEALGQRLIWMASQGVQDARIRVVPEHLGPIDIRIRMDGDSTQVVLASPNPASRDALEQALPRLREQLGDAGLQLVQAEVGGQDARAGDGRERGTAGDPLHGGAGATDDGAEASMQPSSARHGVGLLDLFA